MREFILAPFPAGCSFLHLSVVGFVSRRFKPHGRMGEDILIPPYLQSPRRKKRQMTAIFSHFPQAVQHMESIVL